MGWPASIHDATVHHFAFPLFACAGSGPSGTSDSPSADTHYPTDRIAIAL